MSTPKSSFRIPQWILDELKRRTGNMTQYIIEALREKFEKDDRKK